MDGLEGAAVGARGGNANAGAEMLRRAEAEANRKRGADVMDVDGDKVGAGRDRRVGCARVFWRCRIRRVELGHMQAGQL